MKEIIKYLAAIAKRKAGECIPCGGYGKWPDVDCDRPCPDCADLRRVAEAYDREMAWPEWARNFDLTILQVRELMEIIGVWEKFTADLYEAHREVVPISGRIITWRSFMHASDILTSDKFYPAAEEFLKGEVGNE